ncbi:hypothetical protein H4R35_000806 [Dimargaris xerosporica]|nr:hypothetical protein H4R35_000806 [Dimargaris xerosporica]
MATPDLQMDLSYSASDELVHTLLNWYLNNEEQLDAHVPQVLQTLHQTQCLAILSHPNAKHDGPSATTPASVLRKWLTRLSSLVQGKDPTLRWCGVSLLLGTVRQIHPQAFGQYAAKWCALLATLLNKPQRKYTVVVAIQACIAIFERTVNRPVLQREVTQAYLPKFNQTVLKLVTEGSEIAEAGLAALAISVTLFPATFRPCTDKAFYLCLAYLTTESHDPRSLVVTSASRCLAALCLTGVKSTQQTTSLHPVAEKWHAYCLQLVGTLHRTLDQLAEAVEEPYGNKYTATFLDMPPVPDDYIQSLPRLVRQADTLLQALTHLLTFKVTIPVLIPLPELLDLGTRLAHLGPELTPRADQDQAVVCLARSFSRQFHRMAQELLTVLVAVTKTGLFAHLQTLCGAVTTLLAHRGPASSRASTYALAYLCLNTYGPGFAQALPKAFYSHFVPDIAAITQPTHTNSDNTSSLTKASGSAPASSLRNGKRPGKKRRTEPTTSTDLSTPSTSLHQLEPLSALAQAALRALESLLLVSGQTIPIAYRVLIDKTLVTRLLHYQLCPSDENSSDLPRAALLQLYTCLLASIQAPAPTLPSILPHALQLFQAGLFNPALPVRQFCQRALITCSNLIHPRLPALPRTINAAQADNLAAATAALFPVPLEIEEAGEEMVDNTLRPSQSPRGSIISSPPLASAMAVDETSDPSESMCIASPEHLQSGELNANSATLVLETRSATIPLPTPSSSSPMILRTRQPAQPPSAVLPTVSEPLPPADLSARGSSYTLQSVVSATAGNATSMTMPLNSATQTHPVHNMPEAKAGTIKGSETVYAIDNGGNDDDDDGEMIPSIVDESSDDDM